MEGNASLFTYAPYAAPSFQRSLNAARTFFCFSGGVRVCSEPAAVSSSQLCTTCLCPPGPNQVTYILSPLPEGYWCPTANNRELVVRTLTSSITYFESQRFSFGTQSCNWVCRV